MPDSVYIAIDLKSFYASVECVERGLDPLTTNLVVADSSRTEKTICLAVSPSLKACGISGRPRLFEVIRRIQEVNAQRRLSSPRHRLEGESCSSVELAASPHLAVGFHTATPRMALYIAYSARIYSVYLKYIAPEDIHSYSIDEVFIDATSYLRLHRMSGRGLAMTIIRDVLASTGITATAGIGSNLYLAKVAMDIVAKKMPMDEYGVRTAELNEQSYRRRLWEHRPLTDFWRVGRGCARRLEAYGMRTMGDVARCSIHAEDLLYRLFGVNAELLIDHAWGWEPCTIADIKAYKPAAKSVGSGQVLHSPYPAQKARLVVREMVDQLMISLVEKKLVTRQIVLTVGYECLDPSRDDYKGTVATDRYGRKIPAHAHGTAPLKHFTSSSRIATEAVMKLFDSIVDNTLLIRRLSVAACQVTDESAAEKNVAQQLPLLAQNDQEQRNRLHAQEKAAQDKEKRQQNVMLEIRRRYGKNAILKGMNLEEGATAVERNQQIGGHRA